MPRWRPHSGPGPHGPLAGLAYQPLRYPPDENLGGWLTTIGARDGELSVAVLTSVVPAAQRSCCSSGGDQPGVGLDARRQAEAIVLRLISSNSCCVMEPVSRSCFAFSIWDAGEPLAPTDLTY